MQNGSSLLFKRLVQRSKNFVSASGLPTSALRWRFNINSDLTQATATFKVWRRVRCYKMCLLTYYLLNLVRVFSAFMLLTREVPTVIIHMSLKKSFCTIFGSMQVGTALNSHVVPSYLKLVNLLWHFSFLKMLPSSLKQLPLSLLIRICMNGPVSAIVRVTWAFIHRPFISALNLLTTV